MRQTSIRTSWVTSSDWDRSRTTPRTVPNTGAETRWQTASNASRSPRATRPSRAERPVPAGCPARGPRSGDTRLPLVPTVLIRRRPERVLAAPSRASRSAQEAQCRDSDGTRQCAAAAATNTSCEKLPAGPRKPAGTPSPGWPPAPRRSEQGKLIAPHRRPKRIRFRRRRDYACKWY
jgi:hypothetical protein